jgi:hypothetical protein
MIRQTLRDTRRLDRTVWILTADHGGAGFEHSPEDATRQFVPWVVAGPTVRKNFDLTSVAYLSVHTMSTFATVCMLLGIDVPHPVDARPILQIFESRD